MTTANELIARALRLINVPGRGASLAPEDLSNALLALQELLDSEAVSKQFVPGIRRHFFTLSAAKAIYSYGAGSQFDLRSDDFGNFVGDPAPIQLESGFVRQGSTITNNEQVNNYRFGNVGTWILTGGMAISNNVIAATLAVGTGTVAVPNVDLTGATTYTLRIRAVVTAGIVTIALRNNAAAFITYSLDASGDYQFDIVWPAGTVPTILVTSAITTDFSISTLSLIKRGLERLALPDGQGTDYPLVPISQVDYNRLGIKGAGSLAARPYRYLYTRSAGSAGDLRFDQTPTAGDILAFDVLVNTVQVSQPSDTIGLNPEAMKWLRYALADNVSGEYGKSLDARQLKILEDAWSQLATSNRRINTLGVDAGLLRRGRWSINTGEFR